MYVVNTGSAPPVVCKPRQFSAVIAKQMYNKHPHKKKYLIIPSQASAPSRQCSELPVTFQPLTTWNARSGSEGPLLSYPDSLSSQTVLEIHVRSSQNKLPILFLAGV